ncbi:hypothetical protein HAX54_006583 [Datura stramonium]|uniref:Uncharacterized protein n=1 Tax=Datura stramonium TaxID=4076 RepID=A0ABS8TAJ9_DATST|nr:hypothetical protein [Datura stramonium]
MRRTTLCDVELVVAYFPMRRGAGCGILPYDAGLVAAYCPATGAGCSVLPCDAGLVAALPRSAQGATALGVPRLSVLRPYLCVA